MRIRHKLAYVTEDRKGDGLILSNPIKTNTTLANLEAVSETGIVIDKDKEYAVAVEYKEKLKTKVSDGRAECRKLKRRQPAEGASCQVDVCGSGCADPGRADQRYRRRRKV